MINEKVLENHYNDYDSLTLKKIKSELQWLSNSGTLNTNEIIPFVNKVLVMRGEIEDLEAEEKPKKMLLLCSRCGNSTIHLVMPPFDNNSANIRVLQMIKPCQKCRNSVYSWKYIE